jgi:hypothetical protein
LSSGRIVGILLLAGGVILGFIGLSWLGANLADGQLRTGGAILGGALLVVVVLPLLGGGVFLLVRSKSEQAEEEERQEMRRILDAVKVRGQVTLSELVLEIGSDRDSVQDQIHSLVGMGLFSGYINWDEGTLYSSEAANLRDLERCKHCGGEVDFVGKGVLACQHCGTEYFLS